MIIKTFVNCLQCTADLTHKDLCVIFSAFLISLLVLYWRYPLSHAAFFGVISDQYSLWLFYALSQKWRDTSLHRDSVLKFQLATTHVCVARYPYVSPTEFMCMPESSKSTQEGHLSNLAVTYVVVATIHYLTSICQKVHDKETDYIPRLGFCLVLAPALLTAGVFQWVFSWINLAACHFVAVCGLCRFLKAIFLTTVACARETIQLSWEQLVNRCHPINWPWLTTGFMIGLISTFNHWCRNETPVSIISLKDSLTSSPIGFISLIFASKLFYYIFRQLVVCFIRLTYADFGREVAKWRAETMFDRICLLKGLICYLSGLPVYLSIIHTYLGDVFCYVLISTRTLVQNAGIPDFWLHARAFVIYAVLFICHTYTVYAVSTTYGFTSSPAIFVYHSLWICIEVSGSAAVCVAYYLDNFAPINLRKNIYDVIRVIKVITLHLSRHRKRRYTAAIDRHSILTAFN